MHRGRSAPRPDDGAGVSPRDRAIWLVGAALLLASLLLGILVVGGSGDTGEGGGFLSAGGLVVEVERDRVRMRLFHSIDGHDEIDFVIRPGDRAELDIPHLREHLADRFPTRITYEREGANYIARDSADVPLR